MLSPICRKSRWNFALRHSSTPRTSSSFRDSDSSSVQSAHFSKVIDPGSHVQRVLIRSDGKVEKDRVILDEEKGEIAYVDEGRDVGHVTAIHKNPDRSRRVEFATWTAVAKETLSMVKLAGRLKSRRLVSSITARFPLHDASSRRVVESNVLFRLSAPSQWRTLGTRALHRRDENLHNVNKFAVMSELWRSCSCPGDRSPQRKCAWL